MGLQGVEAGAQIGGQFQEDLAMAGDHPVTGVGGVSVEVLGVMPGC